MHHPGLLRIYVWRYVACSRQSRHFEPFSGRFTPIRPTNPRCERKGYAVLGTRSTWVLHRPPGHCSPASRPTPHAGTSGGQVMRKPSPAGISVTDHRIAKDRTGPDLDEHPPYGTDQGFGVSLEHEDGDTGGGPAMSW